LDSFSELPSLGAHHHVTAKVAVIGVNAWGKREREASRQNGTSLSLG